MYRGGSSRILPALLILVVMIVMIVALVAAGRALFGGSGTADPETSPARSALLTTDADHGVRMTVRGPLVAEENFRAYQVDVSPINRRLTTYRGYQYQQLEEKEFNNTTEAYTELVNALYRMDFLKEAELSEEQDDTRGVCPTGRLYTFEIMEAQSSVKQLWTSSCGEAKGSFRGSAEQIRSLFLKQIPDSDATIRTIDLSL